MKHIKYITIVLLSVLVFPVFGQKSLTENKDAKKLLGKLTPIRANFDVKFYDLSVALDIPNQSISGSNNIVFTGNQDIEDIQIDLYSNLDVESITQGGKPLTYERKFHSIFIELNDVVKQGERDSVLIKYSGKPVAATNPPWDGGFVWETDSLGNPWIAVACEGIGASSWWPNKDHLSDEPDEGVQVAITVPSELKAVSNGRMIDMQENSDNTSTYTWRSVYPIDNYNVTLNVGDYVHYKDFYEAPPTYNQYGTQKPGRSLDVDYYILSYHVDEAKRHFSFVEDVIMTFEMVFGPYPFYRDGFGIIETSYLGMEHQGAIAYGNQFKMGWRGDLIKPYLEFDYLFVHETAHEWWGNNVSVKDRADIWVQEGFASYSDAIYALSMYGYKGYLEYMEKYRSLVQNQEPIIGDYDVNADIPLDAYYKTALMLNTLSQLVENNQEWLGALQKAQEQFRAPYTVTGQEFRDFLSEELHIDLTQFFVQYLETTMIPKLQMKLVEDDGDEYLVYRWINVVPGFDMPVQLEYAQYQQKWIYPEQNWKKVKLPKGTDKKFLNVDTRLFYIDLQLDK